MCKPDEDLESFADKIKYVAELSPELKAKYVESLKLHEENNAKRIEIEKIRDKLWNVQMLAKAYADIAAKGVPSGDAENRKKTADAILAKINTLLE